MWVKFKIKLNNPLQRKTKHTQSLSGFESKCWKHFTVLFLK